MQLIEGMKGTTNMVDSANTEILARVSMLLMHQIDLFERRMEKRNHQHHKEEHQAYKHDCKRCKNDLSRFSGLDGTLDG